MSARLVALTADALDPAALAAFWTDLLGGVSAQDDRGGISLIPADDPGFVLRFVPTDVPKTVQNQVHLDLTSTSLADQQARVDRALDLGGRYVDVGQSEDEPHVVLGDPEGNELCVIEPDNSFLDGCGLIGALSSEGSQECGYFWSQALDWPLVWDSDEETAIQSPTGGTKISWGGPPLAPKTGKYRVHLDLLADDLGAEIERLLGLGAAHVDIGQGDVPWVVLVDPDGHEFCVLESPG